MDQSEQALLHLLADDLHGNFKQVVTGYQHRLFAFARRLAGSMQEAEDIVQEAFVSAFVSLENYPPQRIRTLKLQAWLYRVTLNVYTHHTRSARLQLVSFDPAEETLEIEDRAEERPDTLFERQELHQELEALVSCLPDHYRIAVTCYFFEHLTYQEIAELLDQPLGTVKSNVSRGVKKLRTLLNTAGREYQTWSPMKSGHRKA